MLTFEEVKDNAGKEIKELVLNSVNGEINKKTDFLKYEMNLIKIIDFHIIPVFEDVIIKNKQKIIKKIKEVNEAQVAKSKEDQLYEVNLLINSLLSLWKKTILGAKIALVTKDGIKYIKTHKNLTNSNLNFKQKEKNKKAYESLVKKYNFN